MKRAITLWLVAMLLLVSCGQDGAGNAGTEGETTVQTEAVTDETKLVPDLPDMASCTPQALHRAGEMAGIHFFTGDPDLKVWSSKEFLSAHTRDGGTKTIRLKRRAGRVIELFSGKIIAENTDIFTDDFAAPDTRLYYLEN